MRGYILFRAVLGVVSSQDYVGTPYAMVVFPDLFILLDLVQVIVHFLDRLDRESSDSYIQIVRVILDKFSGIQGRKKVFNNGVLFFEGRHEVLRLHHNTLVIVMSRSDKQNKLE